MGGPTVSYITVSAAAVESVVCLSAGSSAISVNFLLKKMEITIKVMVTVAINVTINVIAQAVAKIAPEFEPEFESKSPPKLFTYDELLL